MYSITYDMSRGIVSQRTFSRKKRKQSFIKMLNRSGITIPVITINPMIKRILSRWALSVLLIIISVLFFVKSLFFQQWQKIMQVKFSEDTLATYQDIELFNLISNEVKWQNYFVLSSHKNAILEKIQKKFPFVWAIEFQLEWKDVNEVTTGENANMITIWLRFPLELPIENIQSIQIPFPIKTAANEDEQWGTLWIQLQYYEPKILIQLNDKKYAVWDETTYVQLKEWMLLWIRIPTEDNPDPEQLFTIETPMYLSWTNNLSWFFFDINLPNMIEILQLAHETFPNMKRFVYLVGSTRFAIFTNDDKTLYFNFPKWWTIEEQRNLQIAKYNILKEKYNQFDWIWTIDLWSLENNKAIIKNY